MTRRNDVGNRLYQIRCIAGFSDGWGQQREFAEKVLRVEAGTYSVWETGKGGMPVEDASRLVKYMPGLTLDFIYLGVPNGLTLELWRRLSEVPNRPPTKRGRPKALRRLVERGLAAEAEPAKPRRERKAGK